MSDVSCEYGISGDLVYSRGGTSIRDFLLRLKRRALRRGIWFRALSPLQRGIADLTARCVDEVRSGRLAEALVKIICRLTSFLKSRFLRRVEELGQLLAQRNSSVALRMGHMGAVGWRHDPSYIRFLGVRAVNDPVAYRMA